MKVGGYLLLLASVTFGLYAYQPQAFEDYTAVVADTPAPIAPKVATSAASRVFSISPVTLKSREERASDRLARAASAEAQVDAVEAAQPEAVATVVVAEMPRAVPAPAAATPVADDKNRYTLVRNIQRELRRVGCFDGQLDGEWDGGSKRAMAVFMDRVNASLPYHQPDVVLLTLVRNHKAQACGETCPKGQAMNGDGRCMPNAIVAKENRKAAPVAVAQAKQTLVTSSFQTTVTVAEAEPGVNAAAAKRPPPLPGRMAMGAPGSQSESNKGWWETLVGAEAPAAAPKKDQTLEVPVGLTHVPEPRLAQRPVQDTPTQTASVEPQGEAGAGADAGIAAVEPSQIERPRRAAQRRAAPRRYTRGRNARPARYARRWGARNVQTMFQHPLGRL